jgi:hypothetical protein
MGTVSTAAHQIGVAPCARAPLEQMFVRAGGGKCRSGIFLDKADVGSSWAIAKSIDQLIVIAAFLYHGVDLILAKPATHLRRCLL